MLEAYRSLSALRRRLPDLTDPDMRRTECRVDEQERWLVMRRGEVVVVANFCDREVAVPLGDGDRAWKVLWRSPAGADLRGGAVVLPPHAGCLLR